MFTLAHILTVFLLCLANLAESAPQNGNVCQTESCLESANMLKFSMNTDVDPCDNFYKYACGNFPKWKADKHNPKEAYSWPVEMFINQTNRIREFMRSKLKKSDPEAVLKAQYLYQSCIDAETMNKKGLDRLRQLLRDIGAPETPSFTGPSSNFSWTYSAAKIKRLLNKDFLIRVEILPHFGTNESVYRINLGLSFDDGPQIPKTTRKQLMKSDSSNPFVSAAQGLSEGFFQYVRNLIVQMNGSKNMTDLEKKIMEYGIADMAAFAVKRKEIAEWGEDTESYNPPQMTLQELQNKTDSFLSKGESKSVLNWEEYFKTLFDGIEGVNIDFTKEKLFVTDEGFFQKIVELVMETSPSTLESTVWFDVVSEVAEFTTSEMRDLKYGAGGTVNATAWEEFCYPITKRLMGLAIAYHFVDDEAIIQQKFKVTDMLKHLKIALGIIIAKADWLDNSTKSIAIEKIKKMKHRISHPSWLQNDTFLNEYYENIQVFRSHDFMRTVLKWKESETIKNLKSVGKQWSLEGERNIPSLQIDPFEINAFYQPQENTMIVPMGFLHKPFYQHPIEALNYGALGLVLGHEVTHGFDDTGRMYDSAGNEVDWWPEASLTNYKNRTQCFIDSYNSITVGTEKEISCNGRLTLDENIADNGGFRESLTAYRYYVKENGVEPLLYGFENFTHEQLYTLAFANAWCEASTDESLLSDTKSDHGPGEARVRGVLMNSEEFAEIWKCPKGSKMNPDKAKCRLW